MDFVNIGFPANTTGWVRGQKPGKATVLPTYLPLSVFQRVLWLSQEVIIDQINLWGRTWVQKWETGRIRGNNGKKVFPCKFTEVKSFE